MKQQQRYRTLDEFMMEHFQENPDQIPVYIDVSFEESSNDGNWVAFMRGLQTVAEAKGWTVATLAEALGCSRTSLYKTLSGKTKPHLDTISAILNQLGLRLSVVPIGETESKPARAKKNNRAQTRAHDNSATVSEKPAKYKRSKKNSTK